MLVRCLMQIVLNGETVETQEQTLEDLLIEQGYQDMVVATALNQLFVAIAERSDAKLENGCRVEIVAPMQGG